MPDMNDLAAAAALLAQNDLTQVTASKAALDTFVVSADSLLAAMPTGGMPSAARQFIQKTRDQAYAYSQEAVYMINQYPPAA